MKKGTVILLSIVGVVALIALSFAGKYNTLVRLDEGVKQAWSQVENVYQRRLDLIPNLVETVKGYAAHEKSTFLAVTEARAKASGTISADVINDPAKFQAFQESQMALSSALSRLLVVVEKYPDLKASQNFMSLQAQLEGTENRITVERGRFNEAAQGFNTQIRQFPTNIIAGIFGFRFKEYFKAESSAAQAPKVSF
ncbi:MAG TPA: LemA family protein [Candidatus Omnitrophota bacterium]|nr:LemA family protein [Candidatus Omnitrophota bacterium]